MNLLNLNVINIKLGIKMYSEIQKLKEKGRELSKDKRLFPPLFPFKAKSLSDDKS